MKTGNSLLSILLLLLAGCIAQTGPGPMTLGDPQQEYTSGYQPIDPLPVVIKPSSEKENNRIVLDALPDETMRLAIGELQANGSIFYGPAKAGVAGKSYVVILDYMKFTTKSFAVTIDKSGQLEKIEAASAISATSIVSGLPFEGHASGRILKSVSEKPFVDAIIPTYLGVGLRLTANVLVREGNVDIGNLFALGAAAQARKIAGTLTIQTLGVTGSYISGLIPMPSEINPSTIQNAILALGAIKAKLYDKETKVTPRVIGVYNSIGGGAEIMNQFITQLLKNPQYLTVKQELTE